MFPIITIFGRTFTSYTLCAIVGIFVAGIFMCNVAKKRNEDDNNTIILLLFSSIGVILGSHILYAITNISSFALISQIYDFKSFINIIKIIFGGSVFYGGLILGLITGLATIRIMRLNLQLYSDMCAFTIPLFHVFARIGCFLSGCCYGIESTFGFTIHNNPLVPSINGVNRFPVQLLEAFFNLILFVAIYLLFKNEILKGRLLFVYLGSYSIIRFFDEFLRGDDIRGFIFGFSTSQFISIFLLLIALSGFATNYINKKSNL